MRKRHFNFGGKFEFGFYVVILLRLYLYQQIGSCPTIWNPIHDPEVFCRDIRHLSVEGFFFHDWDMLWEHIFHFPIQRAKIIEKIVWIDKKFFVKMWRKKVHIKLAQQFLRGCNKRLTNLTTSCQSMKKSGNQNFLTTA